MLDTHLFLWGVKKMVNSHRKFLFLWLPLPMHLAPGELYDCGWRIPTQSPKHLCWTRNCVGSPLGGETAGDDGGGGGDDKGDLWVGCCCRSKEQRRSASDLVMRPHCAAEMGRTRASLSAASWVGVQVEQKIWSSSHAWNRCKVAKKSQIFFREKLALSHKLNLLPSN